MFTHIAVLVPWMDDKIRRTHEQPQAFQDQLVRRSQLELVYTSYLQQSPWAPVFKASFKHPRTLTSCNYLAGVLLAGFAPICTDRYYAAAIRSTRKHFINKDGVAEKSGAASEDFNTTYSFFRGKTT